MSSAPYSMDVSDSSIKIVPERLVKSAPQWATATAYTQGQIIQADDRFYMCVAAGTSGATKPVHRKGIVSDGTVNWLYVPEGPRLGGTLVNESAVDIFVSVGYPSVANEGKLLAANRGFYNIPPNLQQSIHAVAASAGTNSVIIQED